MSGNGNDELRKIQTQIEHSEINLDAMKIKMQMLQAHSAEMEKSRKEIVPIYEKYKEEYERIRDDERDILSDYTYWKTNPLVAEKKEEVEAVRTEIDGKINFLEKKVKGLQGEKTEYLFIWENIVDESGEGDISDANTKLKEFINMNFDINLEWVGTAKITKPVNNVIKISDQDHALSLELHLDKKKVTLDFKDGRTSEFTVENDGSEHKIFYKSEADAEKEYDSAFMENKIKEDDFNELKNQKTSIDKKIKMGNDSLKLINDENTKDDKNQKIMCFHCWEMKDVKVKLAKLIKEPDVYEQKLKDSLKELKQTKETLGNKEVMLNALRAELGATQTKLAALIKSRDKDILVRLNG